MRIKISNIKYDLYDEETNPNDDIKPEDLDLPAEFVVEQKTITELYDEDFNLERDLKELVMCHTGFDALSFDHEILS